MRITRLQPTGMAHANRETVGPLPPSRDDDPFDCCNDRSALRGRQINALVKKAAAQDGMVTLAKLAGQSSAEDGQGRRESGTAALDTGKEGKMDPERAVGIAAAGVARFAQAGASSCNRYSPGRPNDLDRRRDRIPRLRRTFFQRLRSQRRKGTK